jgi:TP901 family phage tail tape measure protein
MTVYSSEIQITTASAVSNLNKLDTALDNAAQSMGAFQAVADKNIGGQGFEQIAQSAERFGKSGAKAANNVDRASRKASKSVQAIGLSYRDVGRIIESQIIFAAISAVTQGFFDAADAAAEFQLQVSRIAAIDADQLGFAKIRDELEQLAAELGRPIEEVSGAAFEALQNDLSDTEGTLEILRTEAQELALVTGGDLTQAVNALSSVYKTFGENAEAVNGISGQFFGTINAGRITLGDLESSLGTLSPLAIQLGVSFKELTDSLATITLTGTKANVATTQLRNVFNKLIKPTKALQAVYDELGVAGFQELSERSGGFVAALQELEKATEGNEDGLARLFNTIRANVGVLNVLTENGELYAETADRSARSAERLSDAIAGIESTAAREAARNAAELEVIFTRLGDRALQLQNTVVNAFLFLTQGSEKGAIAISALAVGIGGATVAVTKFRVATSVAFPPVLAFLATAAAAQGAVELFRALADSASNLAEETAKLEVDRLKAFAETVEDLEADKIKEVEDALRNTDNIINRVGESARETGREIVDAFNVRAGDIAAVETTLLDAFGDARKRVLDQIRDSIKEIDDEILAGRDRIRGFRADLEEFSFEISLEGLDETEQAARRLTRSAEKTALAFARAANVGLSEESQEIARNTAEIAVQEARAALSAAKRAGNAAQIREAQAGVQEAITSQIAVERELNRQREEVGNQALLEQEQIFNRLSGEAQRQLQDVLDVRKELASAVSEGAPQENINALKDRLVDETNEARDALLEAGESKVLETFDLKEQFQEAIDNVSEGLEATNVDWSNAIDQLREDLANATDLKAAVTLTANIQDLAEGTGSSVVADAVNDAVAQGGLPGDQLLNTANAALDVYKEQQNLASTIETSTANANAAAADAQLALAQAFKESKLFGDDASSLTEPLRQQLGQLNQLTEEQLRTLIENLRQAPAAIAENAGSIFAPFSDAQAEFLTEAVNNAIAAAESTLEGVEARKAFDPANLEAARQLVEQISTSDVQELGLDVDSEGFETVNKALAEIKLRAVTGKENVAAIGTAAQSVGRGLNAVTTATNGLQAAANNAKGAYQALLDIAQQALQTAQEAAQQNAQNSSNGLYFGGRPLYRNNGGSGRGQDTIPAMLSPDEFVVNQKSSRDFLPELQAINAGNAPSGAGRDTGDTNITIGDINVSSSSNVPGQTGRDIAISIKRELRRGTTRL